MNIFRSINKKKNLKIACITTIIILLYYLYIRLIIDVTPIENRIISCEIIVCFLVCLFQFVLPEKYCYYLNLVYIVILSFFTSLTLDFFNGTFDTIFEESSNIVILKFCFSGLIIFLAYLFFVAVFKNMKTACLIGCLVFWLVGFVGYVIYEFRGNRLLFADLLAFETAMDVVGSYNVIPVRAPLLLGFVSTFTMVPTLFKLKKVELSIRSKKRLVCYLVFAFGFYGLYHSSFDDLFYSWNEAENSYAYSFFANLKFIEIKPNKRYDKEKVIEKIIEADSDNTILDTKFNPDNEISEKFPDYVKRTGSTNPNIIVVMNESFSDLDIFKESTTNPKVFSYINSLSNTIKGNVYVDIRGGGTADTEYDFLTGNSTLILPLNARPYQFYINNDSVNLVTYLNSLNYRTVAIHPGSGLAWNRINVYNSQFKFDKTIFAEEFDPNDYIRSPIFKTDAATYNKVIDQFKQTENRPEFIFDVTIQNHGGYQNDEGLEKIDFDQSYPEEVETFLALMKRSDQDLEVLVDYFKNLKEPTIVLFFGDHQPKFTASFPSFIDDEDISIEQRQLLQQTPFIIWANYSLPNQKPIDLSINYLSTLLLECAGLENQPYNNYLAEFFQEIPVINRYGIITNDRTYYSFEDENIPDKYQNLISEYEDYSYYNIIDQKSSDLKKFTNKKE